MPILDSIAERVALGPGQGSAHAPDRGVRDEPRGRPTACRRWSAPSPAPPHWVIEFVGHVDSGTPVYLVICEKQPEKRQ
jgi:hypothetical protein